MLCSQISLQVERRKGGAVLEVVVVVLVGWGVVGAATYHLPVRGGKLNPWQGTAMGQQAQFSHHRPLSVRIRQEGERGEGGCQSSGMAIITGLQRSRKTA